MPIPAGPTGWFPSKLALAKPSSFGPPKRTTSAAQSGHVRRAIPRKKGDSDMAWPHLKAATESDLYDGQGSYKNIMYRICSLVRKDGQQHAGWCTASEKYLAETTGFSERQVQRAVKQCRADGVFAIRTYRKGGKEFNHYRPSDALFSARKRNLEEPVLVSETLPSDTETDGDEGTRQAGAWPHDTLSQATRPVGGRAWLPGAA